MVKVISIGFIPLLVIVSLNLLSIRRLNKRLQKFSANKTTKKRDSKSISDEAIVTLARVGQTAPIVDIRNVYLADKRIEGGGKKRRMAIKDPYSRRNKKAVSCIFALTCSILFTQSLYLVSWPFYDDSNRNNTVLETIYDLGVWLSYLTSLVNPILLCIFNVKVKSYSKTVLSAIADLTLRLFNQ